MYEIDLVFKDLSSLAQLAGASEVGFESYGEELRWLALTDRYLEEGRLDLADQHLREIGKFNPMDDRALILSARIHQARNQWAELKLTCVRLSNCVRLLESFICSQRLLGIWGDSMMPKSYSC